MLTTEELIKIQDLPEYLRTDHCYNDLQHAMLVILFRHALTALKNGNKRYADQVLDNATLYLYIHFLNEEEGMVYKSQNDLIDRDNLKDHCGMHIHFLDYWKNQLLLPHKSGNADVETTIEKLSKFYNLVINHIKETDIHEYGPNSTITIEQTRNEMARMFDAHMPMSPFMPGAFDTVKILDQQVAAVLNPKYICPIAKKPIGNLNLIAGAGRILDGAGGLRDRFACATLGDRNKTANTPHLRLVA